MPDGMAAEVSPGEGGPTHLAESAETARFRIDLGYDGTDFHGWAVQPQLRTVQGELENALERIIGLPCRTVVAGRTDAGVHARRQVVHTDVPTAAFSPISGQTRAGRAPREPGAALATRLRGVLASQHADDIVIHSTQIVHPDFDARFSALWRSYTYYLADDSAFRDPLTRTWVTWHRGELDVAAMSAAAGRLTGLHDFLAFCKPRPESTTIRTLEEFTVERMPRGEIQFYLRADAFCHHMVRALVGGLVKVGSGAWPVERPAELLKMAGAGAAGAVLGPMFLMPPQGLVLERIGYPPAGAWKTRNEQTRARRDA